MAIRQVGSARAGKGERSYGRISCGQLATGADIEIPVAVVHGGRDGPQLFVAAAIHGDEVNGIDVLRQVLPAIEPRDLRGTIVAAMVVNPLAFHERSRLTPDQEDMNRVWPGRPDGTIGERMAHALFLAAVAPSDFVVDLHSAPSDMVIHVVYREDDEASKILASAFGTEVLLEERCDERWKRAGFANKLRAVCSSRGIPAITPELGRAGTFDQRAIGIGAEGLYSLLAHLEMLDVAPRDPPRRRIILGGSHLDSITATGSGLFLPQVKPGDFVEPDQVIGYLYRVSDFQTIEVFRSSGKAMVLALVDNPVVDTGGYVGTLCSIKTDQAI